MRTLDISETIVLDTGSFQFVEQVNSIIRLRNLTNGSYIDTHIAELTQRMVGLPAYSGASPRSLDILPKVGSDSVMAMSDHLNEILTGTHPKRPAADPRYDLSTTTQNDRITHKIDEMRTLSIPASRRTLMRKLSALRESGTAGLVDGRSLRHTAPLAQLDERVFDALTSVLATLKDRSTGTGSRIILETHLALIKAHGKDAPPMPSDSSMYRYIEKLGNGSHFTRSAETRRSLGDRPKGQFGTRSQNLPGGEMQIDATTLEMYVRTGDGKAVRPHLTVLMDRATRLIVAYTFRLGGTKGIDHAVLLAQALTPAQNRPDKSQWRIAVQRQNPQIRLVAPKERLNLERTSPFVFPRSITTDNGRDFGNVFRAAAEKFGVNIILSAPRTPTGKPLVERGFHSIGTLFSQHLPGYVGNSVENRGRDVEKDELLSIFALDELFGDWVLRDWNNRPHSGLRDRLNPRIKLTPNQKFAEASQVTSAIVLPLTRADYIDMMPSSFRRISSTGIDIHKRQFDSPELNKYRMQQSNIPGQKGKWEVKTDPHNPYVVWVRSRENTWIECALRTVDHDLLPHLEESVLTDAQKYRNTVATVSAAVSGVPAHLLAPDPDMEHESDPEHPDTDTDTDELPSFDPDKD